MSEQLTVNDLMSLRAKAWVTLEQRYPKDPTIALVKSIDGHLAEMLSSTANSGDPDQNAEAEADSFGDLVEAASVPLFKEVLRKAAFGREILPHLRKAKVPLPDNDAKAIQAITAVYAKRKKVFKKFPGSNAKATGRWHLQVT